MISCVSRNKHSRNRQSLSLKSQRIENEGIYLIHFERLMQPCFQKQKEQCKENYQWISIIKINTKKKLKKTPAN